MLDDILLQVNKPGRYIGGEWNASKKDFDKSGIKFALCFPDLYEVGMSNLGVRIIYGMLNAISGVSCERFFSCWHDLEGVLRNKGLELFSLESRRRMREFDVIGFSLGSELGYTNVLAMLELGGVPLEASRRDCSHPLVIAGGPCVLNPEPMHAFFDLFFIGEAEDTIIEFIEIYRRNKFDFKAGRIDKPQLLSIFSRVRGVYAPSLYEVKYDESAAINEFKPAKDGIPEKIKKSFVRDLSASFFPVQWVVPYIQTVHDRIILEIMRGCPNRCRFCQSRVFYFPLRTRGLEDILRLVGLTYAGTGYEDISLCGLSVSDYPRIEELLRQLIPLFKEKTVSVSLPSIKAKDVVGSLASLIAGIKKTGLTFAPEAGTQKLRRVIGKDFDEGIFLNSLAGAYSAGYKHVKLYFMIGLPFEEKSDLDGIIEFAVRASELKRRISRAPATVNISINTFLPKPHTSLQWFRMEDAATIADKQGYLRSKLKNNRIKLNFHDSSMSFLEGVLSRGDRRLSEVILCAFKKGARFDAWGDSFSFQKWAQAFEELGIDPAIYLKEYSADKALPWDFIDTGIGKEDLLEEFNKTIAIT